MKQTKLDNLCRIVIPVSIRKNLGMKEGTRLKIEQNEDCITIKIAESTCRLCGAHDTVHEELMICSTCIQKIKKL